MDFISRRLSYVILALAIILPLSISASAQAKSNFEVLADTALTKIVPSSFYFEGQSAETQMRNAAAARTGKDRFVIAGLVDTSGYSTEISGKYEGFFITDTPVSIGNKKIGVGAYGFGFAPNGKINIFDISGKLLLSAATKADEGLKRPRPLTMASDAKGVRLYKGKNYVLISAN